MVKGSSLAARAVIAVTLLTVSCQKKPEAPADLSGPTRMGRLGSYTFSASTTDPNGDSVAIRFDWGDGATSDWSAYVPSGQRVLASHAWADTGTYVVRAQAKNTHNSTSGWSNGQYVFVLPGWTKTYGGTGIDVGASVVQTADGGYIIAGYTASSGAGGADVWLIRINPGGDTLWTRTYGGSSGDWGRAVQPTSDGGYIVGGEYTMGSNRQLWLIKTDASGLNQWDRFYGFDNSDERAAAVLPTSDGGYIIVGTTQDHGYDDAWLVKTDVTGNTQWYKDKGYDDCDDDAACVQQTSDGFVFTGATDHFDGNGDVWLVMVGADGGTGWAQHFGGSAADRGNWLQKTSDGGFIIAGSTGPDGTRDAFLIKTDAGGNEQWTKQFGGAADEQGEFVQQTADGGYILAGSTSSIGAGQSDFYLVKTDASGNTLWERSYGGPGGDWAYSAQQTADGFVLVGCTQSYGAGDYDVFVVKTDANGIVEQ